MEGTAGPVESALVHMDIVDPGKASRRADAGTMIGGGAGAKHCHRCVLVSRVLNPLVQGVGFLWRWGPVSLPGLGWKPPFVEVLPFSQVLLVCVAELR